MLFWRRKITLFAALDEYEERVTKNRSRGAFFGETPPEHVEGTRALEQSVFDRFRATLGNVPLGDISERECELHRERLRGRWGLKTQTIERYERPLRGFFAWCVKQGHIEKSPIAELPKPPPDEKKETDQLTVEEIEALLQRARPWLRAAIYFMGATGARRSQTCFVRWESYEREKKAIVFRNYKGFRTKNGKPQFFPLTPELMKFLDEHRERERSAGRGKPDDLMFVGVRGGPIRPKRLTRDITILMNKVLTRDVGARCHAFRRTAASRWAEAGAGSPAIAALLGHSPRSGTRVVEECYIRSSIGYLQEIVTRANAMPLPPPALPAPPR